MHADVAEVVAEARLEELAALRVEWHASTQPAREVGWHFSGIGGAVRFALDARLLLAARAGGAPRRTSGALSVRHGLRHPHHLVRHPIRLALVRVIRGADCEFGLYPRRE
jgi:hypothetical protein